MIDYIMSLLKPKYTLHSNQGSHQTNDMPEDWMIEEFSIIIIDNESGELIS